MEENNEPREINTGKMYECEERLIDLYRYRALTDDVVSDFIAKMLESIVKSWEGYPCVEKLKVCTVSESFKKLSADSVTSSDNKIEEKSEQNINSLKDSILPKLFGAKENSTIDDEEKSGQSTVNCSITDDRIWITEANGDVNSPINEWVWYKEDQIVKIEFNNGTVYKGRVSRHLMHGDGGEFIWPNGTSYKGTFHTGDITGRGVLVWPMQSSYKGEFYNGYRHGCGLLVVPSRLSFTGSWEHGIRNGPGLLSFNSDVDAPDYYEVEWNKGVCHGKGIRVYPSGASFHGHWKDGKKSGYGVFHWPNGDMYEGDWKNGKMHGLGQYTWSSGATSEEFSVSSKNSYYGTWVEGYRHGTGILETDSGMIIRCEWKKNQKHGFGEIVCRNGFFLKGNLLFYDDHLRETVVNSRHSVITTKTCPLNLHVIQKEGKMEKDNIPTHLSSESIDLCYHVDRYLRNKWTMKLFTFERKLETSEVRKFVEFEEKTVNTKLYAGGSLLNRIFEGCFEEKWLRNIILRNLPFLKKVYYDYATILCKNSSYRWNSRILIIRLLLWQILRDCKIHLTEKSIAEFDILVKSNEFSLVKSYRNPFERLHFFQFLHYLLEIAWQLYGKYGERYPKTPGALASAFEKLIIEDMKPNIGNLTGSVFKDSRNLCFIKEIYQFYQSLKSDLTARQLFKNILNWEKNSYLKVIQEMSCEMNKKLRNCDNETQEENAANYTSEPAKITYLEYLANVNSRIAVNCIIRICPKIKTSDKFYNTDYKITFLELYEILVLCAIECYEIKKKGDRKKKEIEMKLLQKSKEEKRILLKKSKLSRDGSSRSVKSSKKI